MVINQIVKYNQATDPLSLVFAALADPTRRSILARLSERNVTVNELAGHWPKRLKHQKNWYFRCSKIHTFNSGGGQPRIR